MTNAEESFDSWLDQNLSRFENLARSASSIVSSLLSDAGIPFLSVTSRVKTKSDCIEKAKRKNYKNPIQQMTDVAGVRVIFFFEHDVDAASRLIRASFGVDSHNSRNRDDIMSINEVGYRSVHCVCDIGVDRSKLPEFATIRDLKFEFQLRTVLQHAWAELAHDRNYKFVGKLPKPLERRLFLLAGILETADGGFAELSKQIDAYVASVSASASAGTLDIEINSLSLPEFVSKWARDRNVKLASDAESDGFADLIRELNQFGIHKLDHLNDIIPPKYEEHFQPKNNIHGTVRDWMMISDVKRFLRDVDVNWIIDNNDTKFLGAYLKPEELELLLERHGHDLHPSEDLPDFND